MTTLTRTRRSRICSSIFATSLLLVMTNTGIALADDTVTTQDQPVATATEATVDPLNQEVATSEQEATPATTETPESTTTPAVEVEEVAPEITEQAPVQNAVDPDQSETPTPSEQTTPPVAATQPPVTPEVSDCVPFENINWDGSYYNKQDREGALVAKATGYNEGSPLCDPIANKGALYKYPTKPLSWTSDAGNPVPWPQDLLESSEITFVVDKLGTFPFSLPMESCSQADFYAARFSQGGFSALVLEPVLYGSEKPREPLHINQVITNAGLPGTYSTTTAEGCDTPPNEEPTTRDYTIEVPQTNELFVCGDERVTRENFTIIKSYRETIVGDMILTDLIDEKLVQNETTYRELTPEEIESCKPETPAPDVQTSTWQDESWACNATQTWQTRQVSTTASTVEYVSGSTFNVVKGKPSVTTERQLRDLKSDEMTTCPVQASNHVTPTLAVTGSYAIPLLVSALALLITGAAFVNTKVVGRRRAVQHAA